MDEYNDWWNKRNKDLAKLFNRFAGKIIDLSDPEDPILREMREVARHYEYQNFLRLVPPGTQTYQGSYYPVICRINAELFDAGNGEWRIGNRFFSG